MSPALVAVGTAAGMVALLALLYLYVLPHRGDSAAKAETPVLTNVSRPVPVTAGTHPLAKYLEIGGIRIREDKGGRARIEFLVINHSGADLPKLTLDVRLRSADREFFAFPVDLPSLGPFESKDLSQTVRTDLKPYELPDWQLLKPQFAVRAEP